MREDLAHFGKPPTMDLTPFEKTIVFLYVKNNGQNAI